MTFYQTMRRSGGLAAIVPTIALALLAIPGTLSAQDAAAGETPAASSAGDPAERARALFAEGVTATEARDWATAEARFRAALELRNAPAIRYNLASVLFEVGRYPEADVLARSAAADPEVSEDVRAHAEALVAQIAADCGFLHLDVIGDGTAHVAVDGYTLPSTDGETPVTPIEHEIVAAVNGVEISRERVTIPLGEHRTVPIDASPPEMASEELEPEEEVPPSRPITDEPLFWVGIGGGAVVIIAAVAIGVGVATAGTEAPVQGNFMPGVLVW